MPIRFNVRPEVTIFELSVRALAACRLPLPPAARPSVPSRVLSSRLFYAVRRFPRALPCPACSASRHTCPHAEWLPASRCAPDVPAASRPALCCRRGAGLLIASIGRHSAAHGVGVASRDFVSPRAAPRGTDSVVAPVSQRSLFYVPLARWVRRCRAAAQLARSSRHCRHTLVFGCVLSHNVGRIIRLFLLFELSDPLA